MVSVNSHYLMTYIQSKQLLLDYRQHLESLISFLKIAVEPPNIDPIDLFAVATNLVLTGIKGDKKYYEHKTMYLKISDCQVGNRMRLGIGTGEGRAYHLQ